MSIEIITPRTESKTTADKEAKMGVEITSSQAFLPHSDVEYTVEEYNKYLEKRDNCDKYRMIFTISPIMTNILFNQITEVVSNEGDPNYSNFYGVGGASYAISGIASTDLKISQYTTYKYPNFPISNKQKYLTRKTVIRDTGYSNPYTGGLVYHCGYDIFNNHTLRRKNFSVINKLNEESNKNIAFNTISDYTRDLDGNAISVPMPKLKEFSSIINVNYISTGFSSTVHEYMYDTLLPFPNTIKEKLVEEDGWLGFQNPCTMKVTNYTYTSSTENVDVSLNKCMNNNKAGEFIDMYPDRSLYSFLPKYNEYLNRYEYNWDYCMTYPYRNYYDNKLVQETYTNTYLYLNGKKVTSSDGVTLNGMKGGLIGKMFTESAATYSEGDTIYIRTNTKHALSQNSTVKVWMIYHLFYYTAIFETPNIRVAGTGLNGKDKDYYIALNYNDFSGFADFIVNFSKARSGADLSRGGITFRIAKVVDGVPCKYYFRIFKKIPNFARTSVYNDNYVSEEEIEDNVGNKYNSNIQKMAFERTIYNDNKAQIIYNDDIDLSCLTDNLGRKLSDVYLTIIKNNTGYKKWYGSDVIETRWDVETEEMEFSHCFGKLTAGIDAPSYVSAYNVHKIHNISDETVDLMDSIKSGYTIPKSEKNLEENDGEITIDGDEHLMTSGGTWHKCEFFGDIVELAETRLNETILNNVYFRFNTAQREYENFTSGSTTEDGCTTISVDGEFTNIEFDDIVKDDYDVVEDANESFTVNGVYYNSINICNTSGKIVRKIHFPANIRPEGYYYNPHYLIPVHKLSNVVNKGSHIRMYLEEIDIDTGVGDEVFIVTKEDYSIGVTDKIYLYEKEFEDYMWEIHSYIVNNIAYIEDLVHYYSNKGGLTEGEYVCHSNAKDWKRT